MQGLEHAPYEVWLDFCEECGVNVKEMRDLFFGGLHPGWVNGSTYASVRLGTDEHVCVIKHGDYCELVEWYGDEPNYLAPSGMLSFGDGVRDRENFGSITGTDGMGHGHFAGYWQGERRPLGRF